jgi:hypothetical protein
MYMQQEGLAMAEKTLEERIRAQSEHSMALLRAQMTMEAMGATNQAERILARFIESEDKWHALVEEELAADATLCDEHDKNVSEETA